MQSVCVFFHVCRKFEFLLSQGSVATCLRRDGQCHMGFVANFIRFQQCKNFEKRLKFDKVTDSFYCTAYCAIWTYDHKVE